MWYVSAVFNESGIKVASVVFPLMSGHSRGPSVDICDLVTGEEHRGVSVYSDEVRYCLGISRAGAGLGVALAMSRREALFHSYINASESLVRSGPWEFKICDTCNALGDIVTHGSDILSMYLYEDVRLVGFDNSIVIIGDANPIYTSCYSLFCLLCKRSDANIMAYRMIQIYGGCECADGRSMFILIHSPDSKRFFVKMYLEACSEREGKLEL